jgi:signal transduction histidine kinase
VAVPAPGSTPFPDDERLWRAVDVFRVLALGYAAVVFGLAEGQHVRAWLGWLILALLGVWTAAIAVRRRRVPPGPRLLTADLVIACAAVLATVAVDDRARIAAGAATLPAVWAASPVLAWAVLRGRRGGLVAAACVAAADLVEVRRMSASTLDTIVLLFLTGALLGWAVELLRAGRADLARAVSLQAAARERERLAADIHDSVLQVLAYVRRRGLQVGGEAAGIAALAGEQEVRLRSLIASQGAAAGENATGTDEEITASLTALAAGDVVVTGPGHPVFVPPPVAHALRGAVGAAVDNVRRHAGPDAKTWILLEDEPERVTVTVRDDGVGIPAGRLEQAARDGRLGVQASVRGRLADVGGTVTIRSAPGEGTEVELVVPRSPLK